MRMTRTAMLVAVVASLGFLPPGFAQDAPPSGRPALAPHEMEHFLLHADVVATKASNKGVTNAKRVTLSDGRVTHDAQIQDVDIAMPFFDVGPKHTEINFRDTYRYNIAGYRLAQLLGLDNVPMSVERKADGRQAAFTWWIDDVMLDEGSRQKQKTLGPDPGRTSSQLHVLRVFDELIQNRDRNSGNLLWTSDWKMWMIDHSRAFRLGKELLKPDALQRCERALFERIRGLTDASVTEALGGILKKDEIEALLARRDVIVKLFEARIARRGEAVVLFDMPS